MRDTDLYSRLLDISEPCSVTLVEIDAPNKAVTVTVRFDADAALTCPQCGQPSPRYDSRRRSWRHLDTMQFQTMLDAELPRIKCREHGVVQLPVPWALPGSRFTAMFEALVIDWLKVASTNAVAGYLRLSCNAVDGIMHRALRRGIARRQATPATHLSVDETSFQRRHEYVTVVTDQTSGAVVHLADDRTKESLDGYFRGLSTEECSAIESVSMDM